MRVRVVGLLLLAATGCESLRPAPQREMPPAPIPAAAPVPAPSPARIAAPIPSPPAPTAEVLRASALQPAPPAPAPATTPAPEAVEDDPLTLATECLTRDDPRGAAIHLQVYVRAHPDQPMYRLQLAELYLRSGQQGVAKFQYEQFTLDAQESPALQPHLVTAHTKLMEIAQRTGDQFGELFHRGVGLLLLVREATAKDQGGDSSDEVDEHFREEMLCKAMRALQDAKERKPGNPRVRIYLAEVYDRAGNHRAANLERAATRTNVVSGELTASERKPMLLGE